MSTADSAVLNRQRKWVPLMRTSNLVSTAIGDALEREPLREAGGEGMTLRQLQLLEFIGSAVHHIDDVARFLGVTPPAATKAVDKLESLGLVSRASSPGDRRITLLTCSEAGELLVERVRWRQQQMLARAMDPFTDRDIDELTHLLERYALALMATTLTGMDT